MNLKQACNKIGEQLSIDSKELYEHAASDEIGGYHVEPRESKWEIGSIWAVEGQILYGLVRMLQPKVVINLGVYRGCSVTHIAEALYHNGAGELVAVDRVNWDVKSLPKHLRSLVTFIESDAQTYVEDEMPARRVDLVFEDLWHSADEIAGLWAIAKDKIKKGALLINHDSEHHVVGAAVREGVARVLEGAESYLIQPSDCGLSIWQNT